MTPDVTIEIYGSLGVIIISAIIYIISKMIFDRRTNKALANDGNVSGRKMLSPVAVTAIAAAVMLIGLAVVPHIVNIGSGRGDIEFIFETQKNAYTPDLNRYTLVTELSAETEEYLIYRAAKKEDVIYKIVCKCADIPGFSRAELTLSTDKTGKIGGTFELDDLGDGTNGFYSASIENIEMPGTVSITLKDKNDKALSGISADLK